MSQSIKKSYTPKTKNFLSCSFLSWFIPLTQKWGGWDIQKVFFIWCEFFYIFKARVCVVEENNSDWSFPAMW